tara:strand:+ start:824 stop:2008 length:1185 start_codon:yes stop_codon:yes gene_type:complete
MSTLKVGAIRGVSASSDAITVANDGTASANLTSVGGAPLSSRNKVINGAMLVSQRNTTFSCNTSEIYTIDRFKTEMGSSFDFDTTITQENDTPDGFQKSLKVTPDSTKSVSASDNAGIYTLLEGEDLQDFKSGTSGAKKIVYSFFAKSGSSNNGHQYSVFLRLRNGSNFYKQTRAFTVTSSWQRFSFAFDLDTSTNQIGTAATDACFFGCWLVCGPDDLVAESTSWATGTTFIGANGQSNFMDNTNNEFFVTGVQLEISDSGVATEFEHKSFTEELLRCQRYFCKSYNYNVYDTSTDSGDHFDGAVCQRSLSSTGGNLIFSPYPVLMRVEPTVTMRGPTAATDAAGKIRGSGGAVIDVGGFQNTNSPRQLAFFFTSNQSNSFISGHYYADAELA